MLADWAPRRKTSQKCKPQEGTATVNPLIPAATARQTYTIPEAAKVLGIGRSTAYEAAASGQLPVIRIRDRILVSRPGLEEMLRGGSVPASLLR